VFYIISTETGDYVLPGGDTTRTMPGWEKSRVAINPINWRTDSVTALLITEPSPLLPVTEQKKDTMSIRLDVATGLLLVKGFTAQDYLLPLIGREGNYHSREIWLYRDQLRENMALRAASFPHPPHRQPPHRHVRPLQVGI